MYRSTLAVMLLALSLWTTACSDSNREAQQNPTKGAPQSAPTTARAENGVSAEAVDRDLEIGFAQKVNYLSLQRTIRTALAQADPELARVQTFETGDFHVASPSDLLSALAKAASGQVVFVTGSSRIDLTGQERIRVRKGVTLASDRGIGTAPGALLYTNDLGATLFEAEEGARFVGLDLMGPDPATRTYQLERLMKEGGSDLYYTVPAATGIFTRARGVLVENCELWGWSHAAVHVAAGASAVVRHNVIHHNQRLRLGYGVYVDEGEASVEANLFDWYRHCVAASGRPGTGYEARYNYVLSNASGHAFDMHGGSDRADGTDVAGSWLKIKDNIVEAAQFPAVVIRGRPLGPVEITGNRFRNPDPQRTISLAVATDQIRIEANQFGVTSIVEK